MQDVFVATDKIAYLRECLTRYNGATGFLVLYFGALIYILLKGSERDKRIFIPVSVLSIITVYNPLFPHILSIFADINSEYYRFFWMTPVIILVPYTATKLILALTDGEIKHRKSVILLSLLVIIAAGNSITKSGMRLPENVYKVPDEMIRVSELIHEDCPDEYPKAFLEYEYNMQMRQYDGKMLLTIDREDYLYAILNPYTQEMIDSEEFPQYRLLAAFIRYQEVAPDKVLEALKATNTEYVVLTTGSTWIEKLVDAGLTVTDRTEHHTILKYEIPDKVPFELVDYSECYANGW